MKPAHGSLLLALILCLEAVFVGVSFETSRTCLLCYVACVGLGWLRFQHRTEERPLLHGSSRSATGAATPTNVNAQKPAPRQTSRVLLAAGYFTLAGVAILLWRLSAYDSSTINLMALMIDGFAHVALIFSLLIWVVRRWRGQLMMLSLGLIVAMLCAAGGRRGQSDVAQLAVGLVSGVAFLFASQQILRNRELTRRSRPGASSGTSGRPGAITPPHEQPTRRSLAANMPLICGVLVMSAILTTTSLVSNAANQALPVIRENLRAQFNVTIQAVSDGLPVGTANYVTGSKLGAVRRHMLANPDAVVLRGRAVTAPGYLRGTTFAFYLSSRWMRSSKRAEQTDGYSGVSQSVKPVGQAKVNLTTAPPAGRNRFRISDEPEQPLIKIEIENDPQKGGVYFGSLGAQWVETKSERIQLGDDRTVLEGIDASQPYVWGASNMAGPEPLLPWHRGLLLEVPYVIHQQFQELADRLCDDTSSAREKASNVSNYFRTRFHYSMEEPPDRKRRDPLGWFLESEHPANCEYFASATALILRSAGVPTRYVTGYVMDEQDERPGQWQARNRDAHAWVEAYDDDSQTWFSVESTPGRQYNTVSMQAADSVDSVGIDRKLDDAAARTDSWLQRVSDWVSAQRATETLIVVLRFAQLPLFLVLAGALIYRYRRSIAQRGDASELKSRAVLRRADKLLRKYALVRRPNETLHRFAARIESRVAPNPTASTNPQAVRPRRKPASPGHLAAVPASLDQFGGSGAGTPPENGGLKPPESSGRALTPMDKERLITAAAWYRRFAVARFGGKQVDAPAELKLVINGPQAT